MGLCGVEGWGLAGERVVGVFGKPGAFGIAIGQSLLLEDLRDNLRLLHVDSSVGAGRNIPVEVLGWWSELLNCVSAFECVV